MFFLIKDEKLLEKNKEIWKQVSNIIKKEFDGKLEHSESYLNTKKNLIVEKSTQISTIIKYQKRALNVFVYQ